MKELIRIQEKDGIDVVSARELYIYLEVKERFSRWFDRQLQFGFVNGVDYTPYQMVHPSNDQDLEDYALTIDCAKEISMIQRSDKGREARRYFIAWEKLSKEIISKQIKTATDSAKRRLYINNRIKEIDTNIFHEMKERKNLIKERGRIDANDFQQLSLAIFDVDYSRLPGQFPNKGKMLKIS